jgi:archaemetzincin
MKIALKPLGGVEGGVMEELGKRVGLVFGCPVELKPGLEDLSAAYRQSRKQYLAPRLLEALVAPGRKGDERVVGIAEVDLYAPGLNFVFGEADIVNKTAVVSLCRLRQEYYGSPPDEELFMERAVKEIVHEVGHTFSLGHCPDPKCVMHFSNCLADTDYKQAGFCGKCRPKII